MNKSLGYIHFWFTFVGVYMVFFPMHYIGIAGFPRRYYSWTNYEFTNMYTDLNMFVSVAAFITFAAQAIFLFNFFYSMYRGRKAILNPWSSNTLEWTTPLHPGHGNWPGEIPTVYRWPYDYFGSWRGYSWHESKHSTRYRISQPRSYSFFCRVTYHADCPCLVRYCAVRSSLKTNHHGVGCMILSPAGHWSHHDRRCRDYWRSKNPVL